MKLTKQVKGYILVGLGASSWGSISLMLQYLFNMGATSKDIVVWKYFIAFITMCIYILFKDKNLFKIDKKGLVYTAFMGFVCQVLFSLCIFSAFEKTTIATGTALLYISPVFVIIMSKIFYKESLSPFKVIALILCISGCFLAVTNGSINTLSFDFIGILFGLGAALIHASMPIFSKQILKNYKEITMVTYMFGFGFLFSLPFSNPLVILNIHPDFAGWLNLLTIGVGPTALGYIAYNTGLSLGAQTSKVGIISTLEIVVAVVGAYILYDENIMGYKLLGMIMILTAVVVLQGDKIFSWNKGNTSSSSIKG